MVRGQCWLESMKQRTFQEIYIYKLDGAWTKRKQQQNQLSILHLALDECVFIVVDSVLSCHLAAHCYFAIPFTHLGCWDKHRIGFRMRSWVYCFHDFVPILAWASMLLLQCRTSTVQSAMSQSPMVLLLSHPISFSMTLSLSSCLWLSPLKKNNVFCESAS